MRITKRIVLPRPLEPLRAVVLLVFATLTLMPYLTAAQTTPAASDPSDAFFDDTVVHDLRLTISERDWTSLKAHYLDNDYYPVEFRWRDQVLRGVGIRSRGTGSRSGVKPGLRIDFDRWASDQKFLGLKSVNFRNQTQDASNLRERISMLFFRRMGVKAVREAHARLFVRDEYVGLYTIVESIDKTWLSKALGENDGHLYEFHFDNSVAHRPFLFGYLGSDSGLYVPTPFKPETQESDPQEGVIERFIWTVTEASDAVWRQAIAEFLDLHKFIRHLAVENFLAEQDGITGDYGPNNFYFYRYEKKNLFTFLPWDKSNTFWDPDYFIFRNIEDGPEDHRNRLVRRALQYDDLRNLYLDTLLECASSAMKVDMPGSLPWLENEVVREYGQIQAAALADPAKPFTNATFEKSIEDLTTFARTRSDIVRAQVASRRVP
jgi:spore coat protein CotH